MNTEKMLEIGASLERLIEECGRPGAADDAEKIDLKALVCFAIPVWNMIAPMFNLPVLPVPAFCNT